MVLYLLERLEFGWEVIILSQSPYKFSQIHDGKGTPFQLFTHIHLRNPLVSLAVPKLIGLLGSGLNKSQLTLFCISQLVQASMLHGAL